MTIKPIKSEEDYQIALKRLEAIFDAPIGTSESDEADILGLLIDEYENKHYAIEAPDPIEAIKYYMESRGLTRADLEPYIGNSVQAMLPNNGGGAGSPLIPPGSPSTLPKPG